MTKVFTPEKVRELALKISGIGGYACDNENKNEAAINEWLEQNPIKPVAVGLSETQILRLGEAIRSNPEASCTIVIREWLKTQTFAQPAESFKAAMEEVSTCNEEIARLERLNNLLHDVLKEQLESQQSEHLEVKEVVVGLSGEQVRELASDLDSWNIGDTDGFIFHIKEWLKTKTFVQPQPQKIHPNWESVSHMPPSSFNVSS